MEALGDILRGRREALGLTMAAVARQAGITKGYLSMIENQRVAHPPSRSVLAALEKALQVGEGELQRVADWQSTPEPIRADLERLSAAAHRGQDLARWLLESAGPRKAGGRSLDQLHRSGELSRRIRAALGRAGAEPALDPRVGVRFRVPLINKVAAGYPSGFTDLDYPARVADEYIFVPDLHDASAFAARVVGASMEPDYREGDMVIFSPAAKITVGSDCFVRLLPDHETTFKRVFFDPADESPQAPVRLQPLNPRFEPAVVPRQRVAGMYKAVGRYQKLDPA